MAIEVLPDSEGKVLGVRARAKLTAEDYEEVFGREGAGHSRGGDDGGKGSRQRHGQIISIDQGAVPGGRSFLWKASFLKNGHWP